MKRITLPFEVTFRVFVAITFAGTITFHMIGLGIHTYIAHQKSHLVRHIESLAEIRSRVLELESSISLLRERSGRILDRSNNAGGKRTNGPGTDNIFAQFHVVSLLLGNVGKTESGRTVQALASEWSDDLRVLEKCREKSADVSIRCLETEKSRLADFLSHIRTLRSNVGHHLVQVERRQSDLEYWDTVLYWLTTVMGLLFMALGWRSVVLQVGNPIEDVTQYLESYQNRMRSVRSAVPALFSIRELRILKESMTNVHNDYLTGILARHAIMGVLEREVALATRNNSPLTVALFDVDNFKKVNDLYGHPLGDLALKHVVEKIRESCRPSDWIGRWGGEEFLLVCPGLSEGEAQERLDEMREKVREPLRITPSLEVLVSVSAGASFYPRNRHADSLVGAADKALYRAKEGGRNRVVLA